MTSLLRSHVFSCECDEYEVKMKQTEFLSTVKNITLECTYTCDNITLVTWKLKINRAGRHISQLPWRDIYHGIYASDGKVLNYPNSSYAESFDGRFHSTRNTHELVITDDYFKK